MTTAEVIIDRPISPPSGEDGEEMNEVSKEFNRSSSIPDNSTENHGVINQDVSPADEGCGQPIPKEQPSKDDTETNADTGTKHFLAPKDFDLLKVIGMGAFGKVLQVRNRQSNKIFAMKVISKRLIKRKISYVDNILAERNILTKIANHPFIVTMHASFQTREKLCKYVECYGSFYLHMIICFEILKYY